MQVILTDEQLVESAIAGDHDAFGEIVKRWERKIFALCFGMLNREEDARDAMQETFVAAFKNLKNFRSEAKISSWLHRIAVNQCLTKQRWRKSRSESFLEDEHDFENSQISRHISPALEAEQNQKNRFVHQALNSLPDELREIVILKEFQDLTFQEIAETLDLPLSTAKSRLYTALKQLKTKLERQKIGIS